MECTIKIYISKQAIISHLAECVNFLTNSFLENIANGFLNKQLLGNIATGFKRTSRQNDGNGKNNMLLTTLRDGGEGA